MSESNKLEKPEEYLRTMPTGRYLKGYLNWVRSFPGGLPNFFGKYDGDLGYGFYLEDQCEISLDNPSQIKWKCNDEKGVFYVSTYMDDDE